MQFDPVHTHHFNSLEMLDIYFRRPLPTGDGS